MRLFSIVALCLSIAHQTSDAAAQSMEIGSLGGVFEAKFWHDPNASVLPFASALVEELQFVLTQSGNWDLAPDCAEEGTDNFYQPAVRDCSLSGTSPITTRPAFSNDARDQDLDAEIAICGDIVPGREASCLFGFLEDNLQSLIGQPDDALYGPDGEPVDLKGGVTAAVDIGVVLSASLASDADVRGAAIVSPSVDELVVRVTVPAPKEVSFLGMNDREDPCAATLVAPGYRCIDRGGFPRIEPEAGNQEAGDGYRRAMAAAWVSACGSWMGRPGMACYVDRFRQPLIVDAYLTGQEENLLPTPAVDDPCLVVLVDVGTECVPDGRGGYRLVNEERRREEDRQIQEELWTAACGAVDPAPGYACVLDVFYAAVIVPIDILEFAALATGSDDARIFSGGLSSASKLNPFKLWDTSKKTVQVIYKYYDKFHEKVVDPIVRFVTTIDILGYLNNAITRPRSEEEIYWQDQYRAYWDRIILSLDARHLPRVGHTTKIEERTLRRINEARLEEMTIGAMKQPAEESGRPTDTGSTDNQDIEKRDDDPPDPVERRLERIRNIQEENPSWRPDPGIFDTSPSVLAKFERIA